MYLPKRLPYEFALVAMLMLGSCTSDWEDKLDVADVNARNAIAQTADLESRVSEIEARLNM